MMKSMIVRRNNYFFGFYFFSWFLWQSYSGKNIFLKIQNDNKKIIGQLIRISCMIKHSVEWGWMQKQWREKSSIRQTMAISKYLCCEEILKCGGPSFSARVSFWWCSHIHIISVLPLYYFHTLLSMYLLVWWSCIDTLLLSFKSSLVPLSFLLATGNSLPAFFQTSCFVPVLNQLLCKKWWGEREQHFLQNRMAGWNVV